MPFKPFQKRPFAPCNAFFELGIHFVPLLHIRRPCMPARTRHARSYVDRVTFMINMCKRGERDQSHVALPPSFPRQYGARTVGEAGVGVASRRRAAERGGGRQGAV